MDDRNKILERIANALERLSPPLPKTPDLKVYPAYIWNGQKIEEINNFNYINLELIIGLNRQRDIIVDNVTRHAKGYSSHDVLLWGVRGMGKSALVKSAIAHIQKNDTSLALIEVSNNAIESLSKLFILLSQVNRNFILFMDDFAFESAKNSRQLRSLLEGGSLARPDNVRIYLTSNHRNIIDHREQDNSMRDQREDELALADRFGVKLGFQNPNQEQYLAIVNSYADHYDLTWNQEDALAFAHERGSRTGRTAWHYIQDIAGHAKRKL